MRESTPATARALDGVREITLQVLGDRDVRVYLFGSSVTGRVRRSSDIDVVDSNSATSPIGSGPEAVPGERWAEFRSFFPLDRNTCEQ